MTNFTPLVPNNTNEMHNLVLTQAEVDVLHAVLGYVGGCTEAYDIGKKIEDKVVDTELVHDLKFVHYLTREESSQEQELRFK